MRDPGKREAFQRDLRACHVPDGLHIDEHLEFVNNFLLKSARRLFPADNDIPRKPWISSDTWSIVKLIAPARKQIAIVIGRKREWVLKASFCVWRVLTAPTTYSSTPSPPLPQLPCCFSWARWGFGPSDSWSPGGSPCPPQPLGCFLPSPRE